MNLLLLEFLGRERSQELLREAEQIHLENLAARSSRGEGTIQAILRGWRQRLAWGRASIPSLAEREQR